MSITTNTKNGKTEFCKTWSINNDKAVKLGDSIAYLLYKRDFDGFARNEDDTIIPFADKTSKQKLEIIDKYINQVLRDTAKAGDMEYQKDQAPVTDTNFNIE